MRCPPPDGRDGIVAAFRSSGSRSGPAGVEAYVDAVSSSTDDCSSPSWTPSSSAPDSPACTRCTNSARRGCRCGCSRPRPRSAARGIYNRYPGARCDVESVDYCYSFSDELQQEWTWTEKYATQAEILRYLTGSPTSWTCATESRSTRRVISAVLDEQTLRWTVTTDGGEVVTARFCIMATGPLSAALTPDFHGLTPSRARSTTPRTGRMSPSTSPASGWRSSAPGPRASSRSRSSPSRPSSSYVFQRTPELQRARGQPSR